MYVLKYSRIVTESEFMKHTLDRQVFKTKFCFEIHEKSDEKFSRLYEVTNSETGVAIA